MQTRFKSKGSFPEPLIPTRSEIMTRLQSPGIRTLKTETNTWKKMRRLTQGSTPGSQGSTPMRAKLHFRGLLMKSHPPIRGFLSWQREPVLFLLMWTAQTFQAPAGALALPTFSKLRASFTKEAPSPSPATTPIRDFLTKTLSFPQQPQMRPRLTGTE